MTGLPKAIGRVAFVYRGDYNKMVTGDAAYNRYDVVLVNGKGLFHCLRDNWLPNGKEWAELDQSKICYDPKEGALPDCDWALFLPMTDVYKFLKDHLKHDKTIDITFYDEESQTPVKPGDANYHNIELNVNPNALTFDSGEVTVDTFSNKSDINKGYDLTGKSVLEVVKELLCPYVLPQVSLSISTSTVWATVGDTVTWTVKYTKGSEYMKTEGWWDADTANKITMWDASTSTAKQPTRSATYDKTVVPGKSEKHKFSVKDPGDNKKYTTVATSELTVTVQQPSYYWYSETDWESKAPTVIDIAKVSVKKLSSGAGTIESGKTVTADESDKIFWYYLIPAGTKVQGFFDSAGTIPNSSIQIHSNILVAIQEGGKTLQTLKCDMWRAGQQLSKTSTTKFTNLMKLQK